MKSTESLGQAHLKECLSAQEAADLLCISIKTLYKYVQEDSIPYHRVGKRKLVFFRSELLSYLMRSRAID
jgi:excisionase family DNA binding protein